MHKKKPESDDGLFVFSVELGDDAWLDLSRVLGYAQRVKKVFY